MLEAYARACVRMRRSGLRERRAPFASPHNLDGGIEVAVDELGYENMNGARLAHGPPAPGDFDASLRRMGRRHRHRGSTGSLYPHGMLRRNDADRARRKAPPRSPLRLTHSPPTPRSTVELGGDHGNSTGVPPRHLPFPRRRSLDTAHRATKIAQDDRLNHRPEQPSCLSHRTRPQINRIVIDPGHQRL